MWPKKKYITYERFARKYLEFRNDKLNSKYNEQTRIFFETLINQILQGENGFIGSYLENIYSFSNKKTCEKRDCISMIQVLSDKEGNIKGINIEYDGIYLSQLCIDNIEKKFEISIEMKLRIIDENSIEKDMKEFSDFNQGNYHDGITHIFGTINEKTKYITYLGFKCISGKTEFVGRPNGKGFLFGKFGEKFHYLRIQMTDEGITLLEPGFEKNLRKNYFLDEIVEKLANQDLKKEELIKVENYINNMNDANKIDKLITTSIIEDDQYFNENLEDDVNGYDYKEVVDQYPRKWIMNSIPKKDDHEKNIIKTIEDALRRYDEECENFTKKSKTMLAQSKNKNNINKKTKENINTFSHNFNLLLDPFNINALELNEDDIHNLELPFVLNPFAIDSETNNYNPIDFQENKSEFEILESDVKKYSTM